MNFQDDVSLRRFDNLKDNYVLVFDSTTKWAATEIYH